MVLNSCFWITHQSIKNIKIQQITHNNFLLCITREEKSIKLQQEGENKKFALICVKKKEETKEFSAAGSLNDYGKFSGMFFRERNSFLLHQWFMQFLNFSLLYKTRLFLNSDSVSWFNFDVFSGTFFKDLKTSRFFIFFLD